MTTEAVILTGVPVVVGLTWLLLRYVANDRIETLLTRRRRSARLATRGEMVDGKRHIPVALGLTEAAVYYDSPDVDGSIDLSAIDEVEYSDELTTGQSVDARHVLRLRCKSGSYEFLVDDASRRQWEFMLPARSAGVTI